jgi:hypothetical protein
LIMTGTGTLFLSYLAIMVWIIQSSQLDTTKVAHEKD